MNNPFNGQFNNHIIIILAGGKSSRAETTKGLRKINHTYWIDHQIEYFLDAGFDKILVGLGYDHNKYLSRSHFLQNDDNRIQPVINKNPNNGAFSTLKCVLKHAHKHPWQQVFMIHIDHALPNLLTISEMAHYSHYDVVKPTFNDQSGHPIMLSRTLTRHLKQLADHKQLNKVIRRWSKERIKWLSVNDQNVLYNLNTQQQWLDYLNRY